MNLIQYKFILSCISMETELMPKPFRCDICDFNGCKQSNYIKHLETKKHLVNINGDKINTSTTCKICNKVYKSRNGLWKHSKHCLTFDSTNNKIKILTNLLLDVIKSNKDLQKQHTDLQKQVLELYKNK